jgi:zinc transporter
MGNQGGRHRLEIGTRLQGPKDRVGGNLAFSFFSAKPKDPRLLAEEAAELDGLICAYLFDGKGAGRELTWDEVRAWTPAQGTIWVHLNRTRRSSEDYIRSGANLNPAAVEALLAEDTRPRVVRHGDGFLVNLRGVNANPGAEPEDMISLRCWVEPNRLITARARRLMAVTDLRSEIAAGRGPASEMDCLFRLARLILFKVGAVVTELDDGIDELEDQVVAGSFALAREKLAKLRRRVITMRRHLAPQRDAFMRLESETHAMMDEQDTQRFHLLADTTQRYVEELDSLRERATVVQDEIISNFTETQNRHSYTLSVVAAIMLPLSFITSLFGVSFSAEAIPFATSGDGFLTLAAILAGVAVVQIVIFKIMRWL